MRDWLESFAGYRTAVVEGRIDRWISQFSRSHRDIAARILDSVDFVTNEAIANAYRTQLAAFPEWDYVKSRRQGDWRFVPYSGSTGESGDSMMHRFRIANRLDSVRYNDLFVNKAELSDLVFDRGDHLVFVDDFSGTGRQVCTTWNQSIRELVFGRPNIYLILCATTHEAIEKIRDETDIMVLPEIILHTEDYFFSKANTKFNSSEKDVMKSYCRVASKGMPEGFGECGFLIVFAHRTPNNSIAVLHSQNGSWEPLFPRHD